jgi:hypothetical protein
MVGVELKYYLVSPIDKNQEHITLTMLNYHNDNICISKYLKYSPPRDYIDQRGHLSS